LLAVQVRLGKGTQAVQAPMLFKLPEVVVEQHRLARQHQVPHLAQEEMELVLVLLVLLLLALAVAEVVAVMLDMAQPAHLVVLAVVVAAEIMLAILE
jgi:hypothetical protein